jgi:hypothetical protein
LLVLALGCLANQFAQDASTPTATSERGKRMFAIALLRTINTGEAGYNQKHGSYGIWPILLADEPAYFQEFLTSHRVSQTGFGEGPEILPGWNLRLNVHADGRGYDVLLEDTTDKETFYAALSDERTIIRESKAIR